MFNTGYVANVATISAMVKKGDTVFSDELNHASIIDGCRLSKAKIVTYAHNDMDDLRKKIQENPCETGIVVSDAVFSMDGDILKLPEFLDICEENQLFSMVDEATFHRSDRQNRSWNPGILAGKKTGRYFNGNI